MDWIRSATLALWLTVVSIITVQLGHPLWLANDDQAMAWVASGAYSGNPSGELVHVHRILGEFISLLYKANPAITWYTLILVATAIGSLTLMGAKCPPRIFSGWVTLSSALMIWISLRPNFTVVAFVTGAVAMSLIAFAIRSNRFPLIGLALFVLAALWRFDSALFVAVSALPILVYSIVKSTPRWSLPSVLTLSFIGLAVFTIPRTAWMCFFSAAGRCESWREYLQYISTLATIHGRPRAEVLAIIGDPSGNISPTATNLLLNNANSDAPDFGIEAVDSLANSIPLYLRVLGNSIPNHFEASLNALMPFAGLALGALLLFCLPTCLTNASRAKWIVVLIFSTFITVFALFSVSALIKLTPYNAVGASITLVILVVGMSLDPFALTGVTKRRIATYSQISGSIVLGIWLIFAPTGLIQLEKEAVDRYHRNDEFSVALTSAIGASGAFGQGNIASVIQTDPYHPANGGFRSNLLLSGWMVFSPNWFDRKENLGLTDIYTQYLDSSNVFAENPLLFIGGTTNAQLTVEYLKEIDPEKRNFTKIQLAQLTRDDDTLVGPTYLWRLIAIN